MPTLDILAQIFSGIKKLPGNTLGAPVDLVNVAVNSLKAGYGYAGSKLGFLAPSDLPDIEENPVGGSSWINKQFGMDKSSGAIDDLTQFVGGLATPSNIAGVAKAVILPAALLHDASTLKAAQKLIDAGREDQVYRATKIFPSSDPANPGLRTVLSDSTASLRSVGGVLRSISTNPYYSGPQKLEIEKISIPQSFEGYLPDVLDHSKLFEAMPELKDIKIRNSTGSYAGSYSRDNKTIQMGVAQANLKNGELDFVSKTTAERQFLDVNLHETQHAIQDISNFTGGSSPEYFMRNRERFSDAQRAARQDLSPEGTKNLKTLDDAVNKAHSHYFDTAGEVEARIVQQQFTTGDYSVSPAKTIRNMEAGGDRLIYDKAAIPKVDDDEAVRKIIDYYNPQTGL